MSVHTWDWHAKSRPKVHTLIQTLTAMLGCIDYRWVLYHMSKPVDDARGPLTIALAAHVLHQIPLPKGASELHAFEARCRKRFVLQLADQCLTPWAWASGVHEQAVEDLVPFLVEHGVPHEHAQSRAQAAVSAIGATHILGALASKIPWKQLKTLGTK